MSREDTRTNFFFFFLFRFPACKNMFDPPICPLRQCIGGGGLPPSRRSCAKPSSPRIDNTRRSLYINFYTAAGLEMEGEPSLVYKSQRPTSWCSAGCACNIPTPQRKKKFFRKTPPDIFPRNCPAAVFHFHGQAEGIGCFCFGELVPVGGSLIEPHTHTHTHTDRRQHAFSIAHYSRHVHHSRFHLSLPLSTFAVQFRVDLIKCVWHRSYLFGES
jgi:hypothetical protein